MWILLLFNVMLKRHQIKWNNIFAALALIVVVPITKFYTMLQRQYIDWWFLTECSKHFQKQQSQSSRLLSKYLAGNIKETLKAVFNGCNLSTFTKARERSFLIFNVILPQASAGCILWRNYGSFHVRDTGHSEFPSKVHSTKKGSIVDSMHLPCSHRYFHVDLVRGHPFPSLFKNNT